jgi:hypothetical protein
VLLVEPFPDSLATGMVGNGRAAAVVPPWVPPLFHMCAASPCCDGPAAWAWLEASPIEQWNFSKLGRNSIEFIQNMKPLPSFKFKHLYNKIIK